MQHTGLTQERKEMIAWLRRGSNQVLVRLLCRAALSSLVAARAAWDQQTEQHKSLIGGGRENLQC